MGILLIGETSFRRRFHDYFYAFALTLYVGALFGCQRNPVVRLFFSVPLISPIPIIFSNLAANIMHPMQNYFELYHMPVTFRPDPVEVKSKFYELSRLYHPDRFAQAGGDELATALRMAAMNNNDAYKTLRNTDATMAYILRLNNLLEDEEKYNLPPAFLMEMMDINEAISDYEAMPGNEDARQMAINSLNEQLEMWEDATNPALAAI